MRVFIAVVLIIAALGNAARAEESPIAVPFVGCPGDGQQGPMEPQKSGSTPALPALEASRVAYYSFLDVRVLAPKGWHCLGLIGSNGETL
ncbi:MAG TPA: hypothetical protein VMQ11_09450, partial [Alphaproteobacteria bacterium]|nr:hypothetical protein [Alphaproteobacteria bacterium]